MKSHDELSKTALRIYLLLLDSDVPLGIREIARALGIPVSTVYYHIKRMESLGLISQKDGGYIVARQINLEGFVLIGGKLIPRLTIYAMLFLGVTITIIYQVLVGGDVHPDKILALVISLISFVIFATEGLLMKRKISA